MPIKASAKNREEWPILPAMTPLPIEIVEPPTLETNSKYGGEQLKLYYKVFEGPHQYIPVDGEVREGRGILYLNLTMGKTQAGAKSMLRQFVEAVFSNPNMTDEEAFDIDLEKLKGAKLVLFGNYSNPNAERLTLKPLGFSSYGTTVVAPSAATAPAPAAQPAAAPVVADDYTYNEDRSQRWKAPMVAWEPNPDFVPPAAAPPPPPPAAVPAASPPAPPPATPPPTPPPAAARKINF